MRVSVALLALATAASAQSQNYTSSLDMTIDPNTVDPADRCEPLPMSTSSAKRMVTNTDLPSYLVPCAGQHLPHSVQQLSQQQ